MSPTPKEILTKLKDAVIKRTGDPADLQEKGAKAFANGDVDLVRDNLKRYEEIKGRRKKLDDSFGQLEATFSEMFPDDLDISVEELLQGLVPSQAVKSETRLGGPKKERTPRKKNCTVEALGLWLQRDSDRSFTYDRRGIIQYIEKNDNVSAVTATSRFSFVKSNFLTTVEKTGCGKVGEAARKLSKDAKPHWKQIYSTISALYGEMTIKQFATEVVNRREDREIKVRGLNKRAEKKTTVNDLQKELLDNPLTELLLGNALTNDYSEAMLGLMEVNSRLVEMATNPNSKFDDRIEKSRESAAKNAKRILGESYRSDVNDKEARRLILRVLTCMTTDPSQWRSFINSTDYEAWKFIFGFCDTKNASERPDAVSLLKVIFPRTEIKWDGNGFM